MISAAAKCFSGALQQMKDRNLEDLQLARSVAAGDEEAFDRLYHLHSGRLYSLACRLGGDTSLAEDMTQEVFIHILRKIHLYDGQASLSTWFYRVAANHFISFLRKHRSRRFQHDSIDNEEGRLAVTPLTSPPRHIHSRLDIEQSLQQLPAGYRQILVLHDVEGYRHQEIAEMLAISPGTSKSQLHHARMKLRSLLGGKSDGSK